MDVKSGNKKIPSLRTGFFGREGKTALELTYDIILNLDDYVKAGERLRELTQWKHTIPVYAIAL